MAVNETGDRSPAARAVRRVLRHWAPYLLTAGTVFTFAAGIGAAIGTERDSPLLPAAAGTNPYAGLGAVELFLHNGRVSVLLIVGAVLFGLPTAYLLLLNGFLLGAGLVEYAETYGPLETLAMVGPHGVIEIPALLLAGAIAFRWCHAGWRTASGTRRSTTAPVFLLESIGAIVVVGVMLAVAALIEATISGAIGAALA
jgi:uncharacterized membrane protein SpoIIM required for sporulation